MTQTRLEITPSSHHRGARRTAQQGAFCVALALVVTLAVGQVPARESSLAPASGEQWVDGYLVRWNTTLTGFLPQQVVENHDLAPNGHGVLNVVVLRYDESGGLPRAVAADVSAQVRNLRGQVQRLGMHPIEANGGISYLGAFEVAGRDQLRFELQVRPPGQASRDIAFERRFLGD